MLTLKCGDCLNVLKEISDNSVDLVISDPPYGIGFQSHRRTASDSFRRIQNDDAPFVDFIPEVSRILKTTGAVVVFTRWDVQQAFIDALSESGMKPKNVVIWDKCVHGMGDLKRSYGSRYESIIFSPMKDFRFPRKRPQDIIAVPKVQASRLTHPNEKPVKLYDVLIEQLVSRGGSILDPFMGTGTSGISALKADCDYYGIEIDPEYFDTAVKRIGSGISEISGGMKNEHDALLDY